MPCKLILVPLSGHHNSAYTRSLELAALEAAFRVGQAWRARVRVLLIDAPRTDDYKPLAPWMPAHGLEKVLGILVEADRRRRRDALQAFEAMVEQFSARLAPADAASGFAVELVEASGNVPELLAAQGKLADLIVVAYPTPDGPSSTPLKLEVALRETGRPVLVASVTPFETVAEHVAVAWNGSREAARAVAMSLDLLRTAKRVSIVSVHEGSIIEPSAEQLADYLAVHGIESSPVILQETKRNTGARLLAECERTGADLLLMGAYTRSRTRQLIFGGATSHVLKEATIPVIMVE
ncbi:MAG: universal stress protein [Halioglobus sp.]|nr:universal stress protein [Halioglobus sp.]